MPERETPATEETDRIDMYSREHTQDRYIEDIRLSNNNNSNAFCSRKSIAIIMYNQYPTINFKLTATATILLFWSL